MEEKNEEQRCRISYPDPYHSENENWDTYEVEWDPEKKKWIASCREYGHGRPWEYFDLSEHGYRAILRHFSLEENDFPLEKIVLMSPDQLRAVEPKNLRLMEKKLLIV